MPLPFICPNCGHRTSEVDRNVGFTRQRKGCEKCGFAFLFELLDDYFPAPDAAFFVCDNEGRVIGCGRNAFEFAGVEEEDVIGRPVKDALGLSFNGEDPLTTVLEWGVRKLEIPVEVNGEREITGRAMADVFPAYDEDGGLLLVLTPQR
jgi:PAS domain-containing protein